MTRPTAILCGTAMLITYAILGTVYEVSAAFMAPIALAGIVTLLVGLGDGKGTRG